MLNLILTVFVKCLFANIHKVLCERNNNTYFFMQTLKERLNSFIKYMDLSQARFAEAVGVSVGFANNVGDSISTKSLNKIKSAYPNLNTSWLLTGEGEMLKDSTPKDEAVLISNANIKMIPLVSQYAQAGYLCGFADAEYVETLPTIPTIVDHEIKGNYIAFEVRGDSMDDGSKQSIEEGEIIICREVHKDYWRYKLHINSWDFVIVHKYEGVLVKRITDHDVDNGLITIHSLNPLYEDKVIPLSEVSQLFNVVQSYRKRKF